MPIGTFLAGRADFVQLRGLPFLALAEVGYQVIGTTVSDLGGGGSVVWSQSATPWPCRVDAAGGGEGVSAGVISDRTTHTIILPAEADVDEVDRFAIVGRGTFVITAAPERTGEFLRTLEAVEA